VFASTGSGIIGLFDGFGARRRDGRGYGQSLDQGQCTVSGLCFAKQTQGGARLIEFGAHLPGRWVADALEFTLALEHLFPDSSTAAVHADKLAISFGKIGQ